MTPHIITEELTVWVHDDNRHLEIERDGRTFRIYRHELPALIDVLTERMESMESVETGARPLTMMEARTVWGEEKRE